MGKMLVLFIACVLVIPIFSVGEKQKTWTIEKPKEMKMDFKITKSYVKEDIMVRFKPSVTSNEISRTAKLYGEKVKHMAYLELKRIKITGKAVEQVLEILRNNPCIEYTDTTYAVTERFTQSKMHVGSTGTQYAWKGLIKAYATVENGNPVDSATLYRYWNGLTSDTKQGITDANGQVTFTFTIDNVGKSEWIYDSVANKETSDSIFLFLL